MGTNSRIDEYGRITIGTEEAVSILLSGLPVNTALFKESEETKKYNENAEQVLGNNIQLDTSKPIMSVSEYHEMKSNEWIFPDKYKKIDVLNYLLERCNSEEARERTIKEYAMYNERNLDSVLQLMIYLVDYMRENKLVWGVGRGSSVSSYILYLIGIHKIDSLSYDLDVEDFLRE